MNRKLIIYGCEARGDADSPYLTRYRLFESKKLKIYLHVFHRSDADDMHDHPWNFLSVILWRGYREQTDAGKKRVWPGMILFRKAAHKHRVELVNGKRAVTLIFVGDRVRAWGFWISGVWQYYRDYFREKGC